MDGAQPLRLGEATVGAEAKAISATGTGQRLAVAGTLLLSAFLNFFQLTQEGYANLYYAAGVKSMLTSWRDFFFISFDAAGFVSIDKPPLGLWI